MICCQVWIGVDDLAESGNFIHFDGEEVGFPIPWEAGQPDHSHIHFEGIGK